MLKIEGMRKREVARERIESARDTHMRGRVSGGDTSITREASMEAPKHYNLRRNARIRCHPY